MCERKAYPHKVYMGRNRIRLRVNGAYVELIYFMLSDRINCKYQNIPNILIKVLLLLRLRRDSWIYLVFEIIAF